MNDCLVPLGAFGFIMKKLLNRWTLVPTFAELLFTRSIWLARPLLTQGIKNEQGGLIFMTLTKAE